MRRTDLLCLPAALLLSACGSDTPQVSSAQQSSSPVSTPEATAAATTTAAPTPEDPLIADQALVRTLFYGLSQSSLSGLQAHAEYMSGNNHPEFAYSADECLTGLTRSGATDDYRVDYVPDVTSMAIDPGWALGATSGRYAGLQPAGRNYILPVAINESDSTFSNSTTAQMHASVLDGRAYFFFGCNETT